MSEELKVLEEIRERLSYLESIVGPIVPSSLVMLDGWAWSVDQIQDRRNLTRGAGRLQILSPIMEKGWLHTLTVVFNDPQAFMHFACDNWQTSVSPYLLNMSGFIIPNNTSVYCSIYAPATPLGPLYGVSWSPAQFWPYNSLITLEVELPLTAPVAACQLVTAAVGRHFIRDDKQFYESIFVEGQRQARGTIEVPRRRKS